MALPFLWPIEEGKESLTPMCKVKIAEVLRYPVRIQASLLIVVPGQ